MINVKTWLWTCRLSVLLAALVIAAKIYPEETWLAHVGTTALIVLTVICLSGAFMGLLLVLGRLYLGCPLCGMRSRAVGGRGSLLWMECPCCGTLRVSFWRVGKRCVEKVEERNDG